MPRGTEHEEAKPPGGTTCAHKARPCVSCGRAGTYRILSGSSTRIGLR